MSSKIYPKVFFSEKIVDLEKANLSIASSAVLYGLSVYTVFPLIYKDEKNFAFRLEKHFARLVNSAKIIGINSFTKEASYPTFFKAVKDLVEANKPKELVFVRATVHVDELLPGTKSRDLKTTLSLFIYEAKPIVPQDGMSLKTSVWRRVPDFSIPSRAKVNGAYVNSVLAKQDAIDSGYDDSIFLDNNGHVCELSAANIFIVKDDKISTPSSTNDILEGINRDTVLELIKQKDLSVSERNIDLTELYTADEIFVCGTSSFLAPVLKIDGRIIGNGRRGKITKSLREEYLQILNFTSPDYTKYFTEVHQEKKK